MGARFHVAPAAEATKDVADSGNAPELMDALSSAAPTSAHEADSLSSVAESEPSILLAADDMSSTCDDEPPTIAAATMSATTRGSTLAATETTPFAPTDITS